MVYERFYWLQCIDDRSVEEYRAMLLNFGAEIGVANRRVVARMANGGVELLPDVVSPGKRGADVK